MEEAVAALIAVEPVAKVVPTGDRVHRLRCHQSLERGGRRVPRDLAQLEQADVEQGGEVTAEFIVEQPEGRISAPEGQEIGSQVDEERHAVGEARDHVQQRGVARNHRVTKLTFSRPAFHRLAGGAHAIDRAIEGERIGAELHGQRLEEPTLPVGVQTRVGRHQLSGRSPLRVGLPLREHVVDRLDDARDVAAREVGRHHQTS